MDNKFPPLPPKVATAVNQVMGSIERLSKDERNPFANYQYAGIESYLEMVRPLCAKAGLIILQDEEGYELITTQDKKGDSIPWLVMAFWFGLAHSSGETWEGRIRRTGMVQASMGSQAFGAAQSYALKSFLRSLGLIATGDTPDADSHEQRELPQKSAYRLRKDEVYPPEEAEIRACQSLEELKRYQMAVGPRIADWNDGWKKNLRDEWKRKYTELEEGVTEEGKTIGEQINDEIPETGGRNG